MMDAIPDIIEIITVLGDTATTINLVLKTAAMLIMVIPMPIVQEEPVILLLLVAMNVHPLALLSIGAQVL
jgi:hypothetical protein